MCMGSVGGGFDLGIVGIGVVKVDVFVCGGGKDYCVLWYKCDIVVEIGVCYVV